MAMIRIGLSILADRLFFLLALLFTAGLFAWASYDPNVLKIVSAGLFALLVFIPLLIKQYPIPKNKEEGS